MGRKKEHVYKPYPGSERFGDWDFGPETPNVILHDKDEILVPDAANADPAPIANQPPKGKG